VTVREVAKVDVYKGDARIGELTRTERGARFQYAAELLSRGLPNVGVAFAMPPRSEPYEVFGTNLHPFFAGLLPEGLRLKSLVRVVKTSEDDLFSLLVATGGDTIGDVAIARSGQRPLERAPIADLKRLAEVRFSELLEQSLRYDEERLDVAIAGIQPKVSAAMISFPLRAQSKHKAHILKLAPPEYPRLIENEAFFMAMARAVGIETARTRVVKDLDGQAALLVERFDRMPAPHGSTLRLHQEDGCQLLDRYPADKYRLSLAEVARALEVCSAPLAEMLKLLRMQAFSYLIGNGDLHAKNVSVQVVGTRVALTPCYDMLSTLPYGDRTLALAMEGRDARIKRSHFVLLGERLGIRKPAVESMLDSLCKRASTFVARLGEITLDPKAEAHLRRVMEERMRELGG
jgi:serine/threonine-protein kinase HipA